MTQVQRIRASVKAFVVHAGKVLVVHERVPRGESTEDILDLPGGGIELGESLREALVREVFEEVGLHIEVEQPVGGWEFFVEKEEGKVHIVCLAFQCRVIGEPVIDTTKNPAQENIFATEWLTRQEFLKLESSFASPDIMMSSGHVSFEEHRT